MNNTGLSLIWLFICLTLTAAFGVLARPTEMGLMIVAGAIGLSFLNIDKIQRFKGAGFEAEMRKVVDEANASIIQLRTVARTTTKAALTDLMAGNFFDGMTLQRRLRSHDEMIKELRAIGVSERDVADAEEYWHRGVGVIFHRGIRHFLEMRKQKLQRNFDAGPEVLKASNDFQNLLQFDDWKAPSSEEMRNFITERGVMNDDVDELLKDCRWYEETREFRRREVFEQL